MNRPPYGLSLPCRTHRVRDGDTIEICCGGSERIYAIRLLECWAPELPGIAGQLAKEFAERCLAASSALSVFIPAPEDPRKLLSVLTFDRILGHIFLTDCDTLSEAMVKHGHAQKEKP